VGMILEIKAGPFASRSIRLADGQSVLIGRATERAQFAVPHDNLMSGVHFAVECCPKGCRVIDKGSTNGTSLNGTKIQEAGLANGDEIKSGQTIFVVRIVPDDQLSVPSSSPVAAAPRPPAPVAPPTSHASQQLALKIGSWAFLKIPERWQIQEGLGIQQIVKGAFPASIGVMEEPLAPGTTLATYVEAHTKMFREHLPEPKIDVAALPNVRGAEEAVALDIRFTIKDGAAVYWRRVYARSGATLGVLTLTTLEKDLSAVRPLYDSVLASVSLLSKE
jgi:pSer/pThr/pTyr-binding forkhead associated (FHA) protein